MILGFTWRRKLPKTGELRNPVTLVSGSSIPDNFIGMNLTLNKVFDAWAKVDLVNARLQGAESEAKQTDVTHSVIIRRHEGMTAPEINDFLVCKGRMLRVLEYRELDQRAFYWIIACNDEGPIDSWTFDNPATPENPNDENNPQPEPTDKAFPFWE